MVFVREYFAKYLYLTDNAMQLFSEVCEQIIVKKNTIIVQEGKPNPYMYIIKKGVVRGYISVNGEEKTLSLWMENETFGDVITYLLDTPASKSYIALEDLILYRVNSREFRNLFDKSYELCNLGRLIVEDFIVRQNENKYFGNEISPIDKYRLFLYKRKALLLRVKQKYIASYLQITPETLSRVRSKI